MPKGEASVSEKLCKIDSQTLSCVSCGARVSRLDVRRNCAPVVPGLGDRVASALDAIGITKDRVEKFVGGPCGCQERQSAMNVAGAKWLGLPPGSTAPPDVDPPT
jgi:hypothetical protein